MKKILLSLALVGSAFFGQAQDIVFNEVYPDPSGPNTEYIELYNNTASLVNLDCYTIVIYYKENGGGAWLIDLPDIDIEPFGHVVFGSAVPINAGVNTCVSYNGPNAYSWNDLEGSFGSIKNYIRIGNDLTPNPGAATTDIIPISNGNAAAVAVMLWKGDGILSNALFTNSDIPQGSSQVVSLNSLSITPIENEIDGNDCSGPISLSFSTISAPAVEVASVTAAPGTNNGYFRTRDGFCGVWEKAQNCPTGSNPLGEFTPGGPNSLLPPINTSTAVQTTVFIGCGNGPDPFTSLANVGVTITDATLLPATVRIYSDNNNDQLLTVADGLPVGGGQVVDANSQTNFEGNIIQKGSSVIVQIITAAGCVQITRVFTTSCSPLPVDFKSFTATRNKSNVMVKWETSTEINNSGFAVERNINGTWEQVTFVPSQALNGNSDVLLTYQYIDFNTAKGITQYRIRQVDFDQKSKYTEVRSVKGDGQIGKVIIYPNPTANGRVNVVFDDASVTRDVNVMDMSGRIIKSFRGISNNNITIDNLTPGIYSVRIFVPETGEQAVEKIVVNQR